jgi:glutathione S-transferase
MDWIQHGIDAPGAADKIRLYVAYLQKMERALGHSTWLVHSGFSMADIAMAPYVNRLAALSLEGLWANDRLPRVERWFERIQARPTFHPAFVQWMPVDLSAEMQQNGTLSWPKIQELLEIR